MWIWKKFTYENFKAVSWENFKELVTKIINLEVWCMKNICIRNLITNRVINENRRTNTRSLKFTCRKASLSKIRNAAKITYSFDNNIWKIIKKGKLADGFDMRYLN